MKYSRKSSCACKKNIMTPKEIIANDYHSIIVQLNIAQREIINLFANNTKVQEVQTEYVKAIEKDIASSENLMHETLEGMVWDNLVIAFFGETNAGKSTIIETMRILFDEKRKKRMNGSTAGIDGMIIGDGSPDYTKIYDEYKLNVYGKPVTLIDVPGIEGKEEDFIDDIKRALKKAHVVFYVQGENKKPDAVIAEKIKKYLNDWVNVYSIYNIKGKEGNYDEEEERENLYTSDVDKTFRLIEDTFRDILGDVYKGNIAIQALLAICAKASFAPEREELRRTQEKLIRYFNTSNKLFAFSRFDKIIDLVKDKTNNFEHEILVSNKQKLIAQACRIVADIEKTIQNQNEKIIKLNNALKSYKHDIKNLMQDSERKILSLGKADIDLSFEELKEEVDEAIDYMDEDISMIKIQALAYYFSYDLKLSLEQIVSKEIANLNENFKIRQKKLLDSYKGMSIQPKIAIGKIDINVNEIVSELKFGWLDLIKCVINPIGTLIQAIWGSDDAKEKAKEKAHMQIDANLINAYKQLELTVNDFSRKLCFIRDRITSKIDSDIKTLNIMQKQLKNIMDNLNKYILSTKKQLNNN